MKKAIIASFLLIFYFWIGPTIADETVELKDGRKVLLKDNGTYEFVKGKQSQAAASIKKDPWNDFSGKTAIIKQKCEKDWPDDFAVQKFCIDQQKRAVIALKRGRPPNKMPREVFEKIRRKCFKDWPDDFAVRKFCEDQQIRAWQSLNE